MKGKTKSSDRLDKTSKRKEIVSGKPPTTGTPLKKRAKLYRKASGAVEPAVEVNGQPNQFQEENNSEVEGEDSGDYFNEEGEEEETSSTNRSVDSDDMSADIVVQDDEFLDGIFDPTTVGCPENMTKDMAIAKLHEDLQMLRAKQSDNVQTTTVVLGDTKHFVLKPLDISSDGLKRLRDCLKNEARNGRTLSRDVLIPEETAKLITQTLKAHGKIPRADASIWQEWSDDKFFAEMAVIFPSGGQHSHHLHDALQKVDCD
jgi:hypothetical protein